MWLRSTAKVKNAMAEGHGALRSCVAIAMRMHGCHLKDPGDGKTITLFLQPSFEEEINHTTIVFPASLRLSTQVKARKGRQNSCYLVRRLTFIYLVHVFAASRESNLAT